MNEPPGKEERARRAREPRYGPRFYRRVLWREFLPLPEAVKRSGYLPFLLVVSSAAALVLGAFGPR